MITSQPKPWDVELRVTRDPLGEATEALVRALREADEARGAARLAVAGGSAAAAIRPTREDLGEVWRRVRLTWTDERCVPFEAQDSNRGSAHRDGSLMPGQPPALELPLYLSGEKPPEAVRRVSEALGRDFDAGLECFVDRLSVRGREFAATVKQGAVDVDGYKTHAHERGKATTVLLL